MVAKNQGPYVMFRHGIEVPFPNRLPESKTSAVRPTLGRKTRVGPKRKADDLPDGQPDSKKHIGSSTAAASGQGRSGFARDDVDHKPDAGHDVSTPRPRHIGGLLSAETEQDGDPESNAPSPTPLEEGLSPASDQKAEARSKKDVPDLPGGASEPDPWGVRTVFRRGPKANNRLIIPSLYDFDDDEIGFRDSTNDSTRKATRNTRGKYLNKPNSRYWHLDSTIVNNNCTEYEDDELDPELVRKHKLHPKYGFFLPDSVNEAEPPGEHVDGTTPIVVLTPDGSTLHASRSVRAKVMDEALESDRRKNKMSGLLQQFVEASDMTVDDITTEEMRERDREARERLLSESEDEEDTFLEEFNEEEAFGITRGGTGSFMPHDSRLATSIGLLLDAAAHSEREDEQEEEAGRVQPSPSIPRASRPYDAVRDIFASSDAPPPAPPAQHVDTFGLSLLADVSESPETYRNKESEAEYGEGASMIDPRLLDGPRPAAPSGSSNAFLQTALNPTPTFAHIAPAPPQNMDGQLQASVSRNPFTNPNQGSAKGSPVLPPLRPGRREKAAAAAATGGGATVMDGRPPSPPQPTGPPGMLAAPAPPPAPQEFDSPRVMMQTNTGSFYPPAPPRSFHHSFSVQEPGAMMSMSMQHGPAMAGPPMMQMHNQPPLPPQAMAPYPPMSPAMSPPMPGQASLAPMPPQMGLSPPLPPQGLQGGPPGPPMMGGSPPAANSRNRNSVPPSGQTQNSGKYRKIAAAPIPHNRPWAPNGGPELRLSNYDPRGAIKDYAANEPPPRSGPTTIRGWSVNNHSKSRHRKKEDSAEETESPK